MTSLSEVLGHRAATAAVAVATTLAALSTMGCDAETTAAIDEGSQTQASAPPPTVRVRTAATQMKSIATRISSPAVVRAFQKATVAAEVSGRVTERIVEAGTPVEAGAPLVRLDATRLELRRNGARVARDARKVDLEEAQREVRRGRALRKRKAISESRMDALETAAARANSAFELAKVALGQAERSLEDATVRAPFDGTVESVAADVGEFVSPGARIATVADLSRVRLQAGLTAREAVTVRAGLEADLSFPDSGLAPRSGRIQSVGNVADGRTGNYPVELWVDNPDRKLRDGMVAEVHFAPEEGAAHPVVPRAALVRRHGETSIFVVEQGGSAALARLRTVRIGRSSNQEVEILEGASAGERVVVDGQFSLADGTPVTLDQAQP